MTVLLHYSSNEGAFGIINDRCLFATNYRYLNDAEEVLAIKSILIPIIAAELRITYRDMIESGQAQPGLETEHGQGIYELEAERVFQASIRVTDNLTPVFIASLCRHEVGSHAASNGLLSQWRGYGSRGGCALEFDEDELLRIIQYEKERYAHSTVVLKDVIYDNHEEEFPTNELEGVGRAILLQLLEDATLNKYRDEMDRFFKVTALYAPQFKRPAFKEENEARIIVPTMRPRAALQFPDRPRRQILTRFRNGAPIPYIRLFDEKAPLPIKRIIVGPQTSQLNVKLALEIALEQAGMDAFVTTSDISYVT